MDELATYNSGAGTGSRYWPVTDHQGSVVALSNLTGGSIGTNTYDEYGRPGPGNVEVAQYTGQLAVSATWGLYNYRNRFYNADIGRFMQTDPIGYADGLNLYAYVGNDPMNRIDPWGESGQKIPTEWDCWIDWYPTGDGQAVIVDQGCTPSQWEYMPGSGPQQIGWGGSTPGGGRGDSITEDPNCPSYSDDLDQYRGALNTADRFPENWNDPYRLEGLYREAQARNSSQYYSEVPVSMLTAATGALVVSGLSKLKGALGLFFREHPGVAGGAGGLVGSRTPSLLGPRNFNRMMALQARIRQLRGGCSAQ